MHSGGGDVPRIADLQGMQNRKTDAARMKLQDKPAEQRGPEVKDSPACRHQQDGDSGRSGPRSDSS